MADHIWVGLVTLVLDIPRRNSVTGWRSHVELDIPRRSSLKGWRIVYGIWQSRRYLDISRVCIEDLRFVHGSHVGPGYTSYKLSEGLADHIWVGVVTLVLDIPRVCIEGLHIVYGSHAGLG